MRWYPRPMSEKVEPIILDGRTGTGQYRSMTSVGGLAMREPSRLHAGIRGAIAAVLIGIGIADVIAATGFPPDAPLEQLVMLLLSIDLFIAGVVLAAFAVLAALRRSVPVLTARTSPLSVAGLALSGVTFAAWLLFGVVPTLGILATGEALRYTTLVGVLVFFGVPWVLGLIFGTVSLRSGGPRTRLFGWLAVGLGLLLALAVLTATILYGLGLTG